MLRVSLIRLFVVSIVAFALQGQAGAAPTEITIAVSSASFPVASLRLADKLGLYEKYGLKPRFIVADSGAAAMAALVSGSVDFVSTGVDELLALRARGSQDIVLVLNVYHGLPGVIVVRKDVAGTLPAKPDSPPEARLKAMDGLTLAAPSPTSSILGGIRIASQAAGVKLTYAYMQQTAMVAAMQTGAIQAFVASSPFWERAVDVGFGVRWLSGPGNELPEYATTISASALQTNRAFAQRNPGVIRAIRETFNDFATAVRDRPKDVLAALKETFPDLSDQVIAAAFEQNSPSWTRPVFTDADLRHEIGLDRGGSIPNLDKVDRSSLVLPP